MLCSCGGRSLEVVYESCGEVMFSQNVFQSFVDFESECIARIFL